MLVRRQKLWTHAALGLVFLFSLAATAVGLGVSVQAAPVCVNNQTPDKDACELRNLDEICTGDQTPAANNCVNASCDPALPGCTITDPNAAACTGEDCGLIERYINPLINFLAALVGIVVTIVIVIGGIQYSASADDPAKVAAAKSRIINAVLGLMAFMFLWSFLQWVLPGGIF